MKSLQQQKPQRKTESPCHTILRCNFCRERFGTADALKLHKPKPADKRSRQLQETGKVKRSLCASEKAMLRAGAWRGFGGIWWTVENDPISDGGETLPFCHSQSVENTMVISDKNGGVRHWYSRKQKTSYLCDSGASLSKFREGRA